MTVYQRIKKRRLELNLSQEEVAKRLGYKSRSSVNKIELGKNDIALSLLETFAQALQCSPAYLMGWEEETAPGDSDKAEPEPLRQDETSLLKDYRKLNPTGKDKATEYVSDLAEQPKYTDRPC